MRRFALPLLLLLSAPACQERGPQGAIEASHNWCPEGFEPGPGDSCFALPERKQNAKILVYVASMTTDDGEKREFEVVRGALGKGYAVLLTHGAGRYCNFTADQKQAHCWPLDLEDATEAKQLTAAWEKAIWQVGALLEGNDHPRFVLGFREGAAFTTRLAAQSIFAANGYAALDPAPDAAVPAFSEAQAGAFAFVADGEGPAPLRESLGRAKWTYASCTHSPGALDAAAVDEALEALGDLVGKAAPPSPPKGKKEPPKAAPVTLHSAKCALHAPEAPKPTAEKK